MSQPMPPSGVDWNNLFSLFAYIGLTAAAMVIGAMFYFAVRYRYKKGKPEPPIEPVVGKSRVREAIIFSANIRIVSHRRHGFPMGLQVPIPQWRDHDHGMPCAREFKDHLQRDKHRRYAQLRVARLQTKNRCHPWQIQHPVDNHATIEWARSSQLPDSMLRTVRSRAHLHDRQPDSHGPDCFQSMADPSSKLDSIRRLTTSTRASPLKSG
jgi:hypothetical protein